jgi:nucleotidyltransferase substrate binding protein (TIGR01987 family)
MELKKAHNFKTSLQALEEALEFYDHAEAKDDIKFLALSKAFEVAVEYSWKELKDRVEAEGLEALSPKDAVRQAARIELISEAEIWIEFINARNSGVHDYFGLSKDKYLSLVRRFLKETNALL